MLADPVDAYRFEPDPGRAAKLDIRVRAELANSLETIFAIIGELDVDAEALRSLIRTVREHRVRPGVFGLYTDLVEALLADDLARAQQLLPAILDRDRWRAGGLRTVTLEDAELGSGEAQRYRRLLDDAGRNYIVGPVAPELRARAEALLGRTMGLVHGASPRLAGEVRALVSEIVLVENLPDGDGRAFDGAFTFYLWGALFLNAARQNDRLAMACALAHESAHALLLGMTLGAKLVENPDDELYPSPLRRDPRPMDGLVHAAFVLARTVHCLRDLIGSGWLTAAETERAAGLLRSCAEDFGSALRTVRPNARFTPTGAAVFAHAEAYMVADRDPAGVARRHV